MVIVPSMRAHLGYTEPPQWWGNVSGGGEPVLQAFRTTPFLLMITGPAAFLEVSLLPLPGSARMGGAIP